MKNLRTIAIAVTISSLLGGGVYAATKYLRDFSAVVGITDNDNTFWCQVNGGCTASDPLKRVTMAQIWQYVFSKVSGDFSINPSTGVGTLANTAVTPGTYGDSTHVFQGTVNSKGDITSAANVAIAGSAGGTVTTVKDPSTTVASPAIVNFTTGCVVTNNAGNADVSCPGGGGGSGTVNAGAAGELGWYAGAGTAISGNPNVKVLGGALVSNFNAVALPAAPSGGATVFQGGSADGNTTRLLFDSFGSGGGVAISGRMARGTNASKTALQLNDVMVSLNAFGFGSTAYSTTNRGRFAVAAAQTWTDSAQGTRATIATTPNGGTTSSDRVTIENDGGVTVAADATGAPPTGGSKGPGTVNVSSNYYVNGVALAGGTGIGVNNGTNTTSSVNASGTTSTTTNREIIIALTTSIVRTLPLISSLTSNDKTICYDDAGQNVTALHTLTITANAADAINGGSAGGSIGPWTSLTSNCFRIAGANNWAQADGVPTSNAPAGSVADSLGINGLGYGSLTTIMDAAFSSTQGSVLYRGASSWAALGPGTSGQVLQTAGAGANPAWATPSAAVSVTAATPNLVVTPSPGTGTFTVGATIPLNPQSGNSAYTIVAGDATKVVQRTNTVTQTDPVPQATGSFGSGLAFGYKTGTVGNTLTSTTSTINGIAGATGIKLGIQQSSDWFSDGTNWNVALGVPQPPTQTGTTVLYDNMTWGSPGGGITCPTGFTADNGECRWTKTPAADANCPGSVNCIFWDFGGLGLKEIKFRCQNITAGTSNVVGWQVHTAGGSWQTGATDYERFAANFAAAGYTSAFDAPGAGHVWLFGNVVPTSGDGTIWDVNFHDFSTAGVTHTMTLVMMGQPGAGSAQMGTGRFVPNTTALDRVRIVDTQGTPTAISAGSTCTAVALGA